MTAPTPEPVTVVFHRADGTAERRTVLGITPPPSYIKLWLEDGTVEMIHESLFPRITIAEPVDAAYFEDLD